MESTYMPKINNTIRNFTTRDNLGIEGIANTISADLCPVVNTVTPRPYYWAFITWCYWKYYDLFGYIKDAEVCRFIKRNNYYIALGNLLAGNVVVGGFTGITNIESKIIKDNEFFDYDESYITGIGAMGYYRPGLETMNLVITQRADTGERYKEPHITPKGVQLAKAFDSGIAVTDYYNNSLLDGPVSKKKLLELGKNIQIEFKGFDECKRLLIHYLFESDALANLSKCKDYILFIKNHTGIEPSSLEKCRRIFFDEFSIRGTNKPIDDNLRYTASGWEIVTGRQYFTVGLEIIWQFMLNQLSVPMTIQEWVACVLARQQFSFEIKSPLSSIAKNYTMNSSEIESLLESERYCNSQRTIEHGLAIMLSVFNRFTDREDLEELSGYIALGGSDSISIKGFMNTVEEYKKLPIKDFLIHILINLLINQHLKTAFYKMIENRNGYYIEEINGKYLTSHDFYWGFQGNRMVQLFNVMKDLGVI